MSLQREYNSASGSDITAVIGGKIVGELQAISYSTTREKAPVYTMGSPDPRSFARGKRAVAGTLVFATFDHTAILEYFNLGNDKVYVNKYDIEYAWSKGGGLQYETTDPNLTGSQSLVGGQLNSSASEAGDLKQQALPWYPDQIPPFDVYIVAENEYGSIAKKAILGVEILNEGGGVSVDDLMLAEQYTYVARGITPWTRVKTSRAKNATFEVGQGGGSQQQPSQP